MLAGAILLVVAIAAVSSAGGGATSGGREEAKAPAPPPQLPRGGRSILPENRVVAFYGAPQDEELGELGIGSPDRAAKRLAKQARPYRLGRKPVLPAFELISTVASGAPGANGKYSYQQPKRTIDRYYAAARRAKALYVLDIQPGHADFMDEARRLEPWLAKPDVSLALDPEWLTPGQVPGKVIGSVDAAKVNQVSAWLARLVKRRNLPEKLLIVHQFTEQMITSRAKLARRPGVAIVLNVDGFGDRPNKISKYRGFTRSERRFPHGFKLFYREDTNLMKPRDVLRLRPRPAIVVYE